VKRLLFAGAVAVIALAAIGGAAGSGTTYPRHPAATLCQQDAALCTEAADSLGAYYDEAGYTGHDEPSLLFLSDKKKSGSDVQTTFRLPTDPSAYPNPDGTGAVWNFELRPAFWFGMAMCDNESAPEYTKTCKAASDSNIATSLDPNAKDYIGKHAGAAYLEMQFYPPGWVAWPPGVSCSPTQWCAALNIDSLSEDQNGAVSQNESCLDNAGIEPVAFSWITHNGKPQEPVDPSTVFQPPFSQITPDLSKDLLMNPGDVIDLHMHDTGEGIKVEIEDRTSHDHGSMTASGHNGWHHVLYQPGSSTCNTAPYDFHPMYASSNDNTTVPWAAHTYNVAFSDEIGHFETCNAVDGATGNCTSAGANDPDGLDDDDVTCFNADDSLLIPIAGCIGADDDYDGASYGLNWPGTGKNSGQDAKYHSTSILFTSPLFNGNQNYSRVAFEADLPRIEAPDSGGICNRFTGENCVNPPPGAAFYPIYTTGSSTGNPSANGHCIWQMGGTGIKGTTNTFGGNSTAEYGPLLFSFYPGPNPATRLRANNFRNVLSTNPCPA